MSIFTKNIKTFKTDILGHEVELRCNLAVWLYLEADFGIKQGEWADVYLKEKNIASAKFLVSILKANKLQTTLEEVLENVTDTDLEVFILKYQEAMYGDQTATLLQMLGITDDSELGKNILEEQVEDLVHSQPEETEETQEIDWDDIFYKCRTWFNMTMDEFMYDFSLEYIVYMINRYIEDNYTTNDSEEGIRVTNASNIL